MVVDELITLLGFKVDKAQLAGANQMMDQVTGKMSDLAMMAGTSMAAFFGIGKAISLVMGSIQGAAKLEAMNAEFEVMLGNAEAAKYLTQEINQFAAETPFETKGLVGNIRLMMSFGQSAKEALAAVKMLGDVAGSDQNKLNSLSLAYGQIMASGRLQGQDLLQLINAGFNPLKELTKSSHKSMGELKKDMEQGKISADMVTEAFKLATGPGGLFFGNMLKQSQTLNGLWSTLHDNFAMMMVAFGNGLIPYIKEVINALIPMVEGISEAYNQLMLFFGLFFSDGPSAESTALAIAAAFATIADVVMVIGVSIQTVRTVLDGLMTVVMGLITGIVTLVSGIVVIPLKLLALIDEKIAGLLRKVGMFSGVAKWLTGQGIEVDNLAETAMTPARFMGSVTAGFAEQTGADWQKGLDLSALIGGSAKTTDPKIKLTPEILAKLSGQGKVVNNNIHNEVTVHAEGSYKDLLKEGANSVFSLTFGQNFATRLVAATS